MTLLDYCSVSSWTNWKRRFVVAFPGRHIYMSVCFLSKIPVVGLVFFMYVTIKLQEGVNAKHWKGHKAVFCCFLQPTQPAQFGGKREKKSRWCSKTNQSLWRIDFCQPLLNGLKTSRRVPFFPRHKADSPPLEINDNHSVDLPAKAVNYTCTAYPPPFTVAKFNCSVLLFIFFFLHIYSCRQRALSRHGSKTG